MSRSRVFQLKALTPDDLAKAARAALADRERGYGKWNVSFAEGALEHLVDTASGDARSLLNALELAVETSVPAWPPSEGTAISIDMKTAEESIQQKVVLYDRDGDYHYDVISAFIKSLRGRDPDAALYWLARMIAAGEDPGFIFRRMLISACEDTGLADPHAITVVESCAAAFDRVGLPEGRYHLTHAALYLATAPKSNSAMAFFDALSSVEKEDTEVPNHLRDGNRDAEGFGHGQGYIYPHSYREHWAAQQYLPDQLVGRVYYTPSTQGYEGEIRNDVLTRRELQIATIIGDAAEAEAASERDDAREGKSTRAEGSYDRFYFGMEGKKKEYAAPKGEILTFSPGGSKRDEWTKRLDSGKSKTLLEIRNLIMDGANIARHHRVLIFGADDGLLVWEAGRRAPEGFAAGLCSSERGKETLEQYAATLDELDRPQLATARETEENPFAAQFDRIVARDPGSTENALIDFARAMKKYAADEAQLVFTARIPAQGMRLSGILPPDDPQNAAITAAEDGLYGNAEIPIFAWNERTLADALAKEGYGQAITVHQFREAHRLQKEDIARWLDPAASPYGESVNAELGAVGCETFRRKLEIASRAGPINWTFAVALVRVSYRA